MIRIYVIEGFYIVACEFARLCSRRHNTPPASSQTFAAFCCHLQRSSTRFAHSTPNSQMDWVSICSTCSLAFSRRASIPSLHSSTTTKTPTTQRCPHQTNKNSNHLFVDCQNSSFGTLSVCCLASLHTVCNTVLYFCSCFKIRVSCVKATSLSLVLTIFPFLDIPVFWPILVVYFIGLFVMTMRKQIQHMLKHKYVPFSLGKPKYQAGGPSSMPAAPKRAD